MAIKRGRYSVVRRRQVSRDQYIEERFEGDELPTDMDQWPIQTISYNDPVGYQAVEAMLRQREGKP